MLTVDDYTQLVTARLFDFFNRHSPWHLALWSIGTALALDEVVEYSDLTRVGAFTSKDGLTYVAESACRLINADAGVRPAFRQAILEALADRALASEAGAATLRHLADRLRQGYLSQLAAAVRDTDRPGVESLASAVGAHLLDLGFSSGFLNEWLRDLVKTDQRDLHIADVLDEAATLCSAPLCDFEVVIPFVGVPGGYAGPMPQGWLDAQQTKEWLSQVGPPPEGDLRQAGSVMLTIRTRDPWSAVEVAAELVAQAAARVAVGSRMGQLRSKGMGWVRGHQKVYPLNPRTRVRLRSLKTAQHVFKVSADPADAVGI